ncbi:hypothetical protein ACFL21_03220 [Patescibacteria group bacterium]
MIKKTIILAIITIIAFSACSKIQSQEESKESPSDSSYEADGFVEYETDLTDEDINEISASNWPGRENYSFIHDGYEKVIPNNARRLGFEMNCPSDTKNKQDCAIITDYKMPEGFDETSELEAFVLNDQQYLIFKPKNDDYYHFFEDETEIFKEKLHYGAVEPTREIESINGDAAIVYSQEIDKNDGEDVLVVLNTYYRGKTLNEEFDLDESYSVFEYGGKLGLIAKKDNDLFIIFDGEKVTNNFDKITIYSCCSIQAYPFEIYENGTLFFAAERNGKIIYVEVDLNR